MMQAQSYKSICPQCGGNDYYITPHNGKKYCFHCTYFESDGKFNPVDITPSPNIEAIRNRYTQAAIYYHSCLQKEHYDYLRNRGYTDKIIEERKIGFCPHGTHPMYHDAIAKEAGLVYQTTTERLAFLEGRITFPYIVGSKIVDIRGRLYKGECNGERYKSPYGGVIYRGAVYPYNYNQHKENKLIITEGEIKSDVVTQELGIASIGIPGINAWRKGYVPLEDQENILIFDNQQKNMHLVRKAINKIAQYIHNLWIVTLPLMGRSKMDIDTFIIEYGKDMARMIIDGAMPYNKWQVYAQRF